MYLHVQVSFGGCLCSVRQTGFRFSGIFLGLFWLGIIGSPGQEQSTVGHRTASLIKNVCKQND